MARRTPNRSLFDMLNAAKTEGPPAVTDAAEMLRRFNAPIGVADTSTDRIAERASTGCDGHSHPTSAAMHFTECAEIPRATPMSKEDSDLLSGSWKHEIGGSRRGRADGGEPCICSTWPAQSAVSQPSGRALAATRDLLIAVPDPIAAIEVLAGRADPARAMLAIR